MGGWEGGQDPCVMAAGLAAGAGSIGGAVWGGAAEADETAGEAVELQDLTENATQDESTPLLGRGRAGKPKKWRGGWSRQLNKAKTRNYYKNWGSGGRPVPITKPGYTTTAAGEVAEEPTETTPLTPKQQEIRNRVSGRPFRSYQYKYNGRTYHTTNKELSDVYNQGIRTQRNPVQLGSDHRFGSIPAEPELPFYPYTLSQNHLNPALQMSHLRSKRKMLDKNQNLVRPNYKWLRRLGLQQQDAEYVTKLKRQRNKKKAKVKAGQSPAVTAQYEPPVHIDDARTTTATTNEIFFTPQVCKMELPHEHKYLEQMKMFVKITQEVLEKSKYNPEKNSEIRCILQKYLSGHIDVTHLLRTAEMLSWLEPKQYLMNLISIVEQNRSTWYAAHWLKNQM